MLHLPLWTSPLPCGHHLWVIILKGRRGEGAKGSDRDTRSRARRCRQNIGGRATYKLQTSDAAFVAARINPLLQSPPVSSSPPEISPPLALLFPHYPMYAVCTYKLHSIPILLQSFCPSHVISADLHGRDGKPRERDIPCTKEGEMNSGGREGGRSLDVGVLFGVTQSSTVQGRQGEDRQSGIVPIGE